MSAEASVAYEEMRRFRKTERAQLVETLRDLIEETRKRAKSHYTSSKERARWVRLAGQLVWYKDQVLRSLSYEALEEEVAQLKAALKETSPPPEQNTQRRIQWKGPPKKKPRIRRSPTKR